MTTSGGVLPDRIEHSSLARCTLSSVSSSSMPAANLRSKATVEQVDPAVLRFPVVSSLAPGGSRLYVLPQGRQT